ncbi:MAG TPA: Uma2 family endonuclease [Phormidium sp.]
METLTISVPPAVKFADEQFFQLCIANEEWQFEMSAEGELIIMPPNGGESGIINSDLNFQVSLWNRHAQLGKVFDSSTIFQLANGAKRSPDVSWVTRERWEALTTEQKKQFPPLCPDFIIELLSETDSLEKLRVKMKQYLANGMRLGSLIHTEKPLIEIYRPQQNVEIINLSFNKLPTLSGEQVLPGLIIDLTKIWQP